MTLLDLHSCFTNVEENMIETQDYTNFNIWRGDNIHLKILVPSIAAGAIIGKGGETIAQVQKEAGARVKMSKANDFYPGTTERVCLIMGAVDSVRKVHSFIMEKIREKPDPNPKPEESKSNFERHRQVTEAVPSYPTHAEKQKSDYDLWTCLSEVTGHVHSATVRLGRESPVTVFLEFCMR